jgi:hypothetical protein
MKKQTKQAKKRPATKQTSVARSRKRAPVTTRPASPPARPKRTTHEERAVAALDQRLGTFQRTAPGTFVVTAPAPPPSPPTTYARRAYPTKAAEAQADRDEHAARNTPAPPPQQAWRKQIDWVAAGKKAYETRMRNLAAKASGQAPPAPAPKSTNVLAHTPGRKKAGPTPAPLAEGDISRR